MLSAIIQAWHNGPGVEHLINLSQHSASVEEVILITDGALRDAELALLGSRARVIKSRFCGRGAALEEGLREARGDVLVFLDGSLRAGSPDTVDKLAAPILAGLADLVKSRSIGIDDGFLSPMPWLLLTTCFPEFCSFSDPTTSLFAIRRDLMERLSLEFDSGALVGLLVDAHFAGARIINVEIDGLDQAPPGMKAEQIMRVILNRAEQYGRLSIGYTQEIEDIEATARADWAMALRRVEGASRVALFDMDGTLLRERSILELARRTGRLRAVLKYLENAACTPDERCELIADSLAGVPRGEFAETARNIPLSPGALETVVALRRNGYRVGIVSDGYQIVADIVRRRVSADFSIGTAMHFRNGKATGQITHSPMFRHRRGCRQHRNCKVNALLHLQERLAIPAAQVLAVGDGENDVCLLRAAGLGIGFEPKSESVREAAGHVIHGDLRKALRFAPAVAQTAPPGWNGLSAVPLL